MDLAPQACCLKAADEPAAIGIDLHQGHAAEAVMGAHHIAAAPEEGLADHREALMAQAAVNVHAVHIAVMAVIASMVVEVTIAAMVPVPGLC